MPYANNHYVIVEDPKGEYWEGSLVDPVTAHRLGQRNVILLPVVPDLFRLSGVGGFSKRAWGAGWSLDTPAPKHVTPLTMFCANVQDSGRQVCNVIRWVARLQHDDTAIQALKDGQKLQGSVRLVPDGNQRCMHRLGMSQKESPVDFSQYNAVDDRGGWTVGGMATASIPADDHYGFALYGRAPGVRVLWVAASLAY